MGGRGIFRQHEESSTSQLYLIHRLRKKRVRPSFEVQLGHRVKKISYLPKYGTQNKEDRDKREGRLIN